MLLTKLIYGMETDSKKTPFGLLNNQMRCDCIVQSGGWFNIEGNRLGCGDLNLTDMHNISKSIPTNEAFFVLSEAASTWDLPSHLDRTAPGFAYVIQKAIWLIYQTNEGKSVVRIRDDIEKADTGERDGKKYVRIPRRDIYKAFNYDASGMPIPTAPKKQENDSDSNKKDVALKTTTAKKTSTVCPICHVKIVNGDCICTLKNKLKAGKSKTTAAHTSTLAAKPIQKVAATKNPASIKTPAPPTKINNPHPGSGPSLTLPPKRAKIRINVVP